eukprot:6366796-Amphidinium_carterae.1
MELAIDPNNQDAIPNHPEHPGLQDQGLDVDPASGNSSRRATAPVRVQCPCHDGDGDGQGEPERFQCDFCPFVAKNYSELQAHKRRSH